MSRGRSILYALAAGALILALYRLLRDDPPPARSARDDATASAIDGAAAPIVVTPSVPVVPRPRPRLLRQDAGPPRNEERGHVEGFVRRYHDGRSIAGALLVFVHRGRGGEQVAVSSGAHGRYRVDLPPGPYQLRVRAPGFAALRDATHLVVMPGAVAPDFHLDLHQLVPLSGSVSDKDGQPVAGAEVAAISAWHPARGELAGTSMSAQSDARGRFTLALPPGRVTLRVSAGRDEQRVGPLQLPAADVAPRVDGLRVTFGAGAGATLAGRVLGPGGARAPSALVWLRDELGTRKLPCDAEGRFVAGGLPPGSKLLQAQGTGFSPSRVTALTVRLGAENRATLELAPLREISGHVRSAVDASGAASTRGAGIGDVRLRAWLTAPGGGPGIWLAPPLRARSAVDGSYRLSAVPDLPLLVTALAPDGRRASRGGVAPGSRELDLLLMPTGGLVGTVTEAPLGKPLNAVLLRLSGDGLPSREIWIAARRGAYALEGLSQGIYRVSVGADRKAAKVLPQVSVIGGANVSANAALEAAGRIVGLVRDRRGAALPGARVTLDDELHTHSETDGQGRYQLRGVGAGMRTLTITRPGFAATTLRGVSVFVDQQSSASPATLKPLAQGRAPAARLSGVGLALELVERRLLVERVEVGGAAELAGLRAGDQVLALDGQSITGMSYADARRRLEGLPGTVLTLRLKRGEGKRSKVFGVGVLRDP